MVIDDEAEIGELVKRMLENFGYKTDIFNTGVDAIKAFSIQPEKYDMIITDLTMPQLNGLETAEALHHTRSDIPIIIMTGFGDNLTNSTREQYKITNVIGKPIIVKELTSAIRKVFDQ